MTPIVFMPGFDGDARLRQDFVDALARDHPVRPVGYPNRMLGTLDAYRTHAMAQVPVEWSPVLVAESFSGLVAARWASVDPRVRGVVLCGSFARNPLGGAAAFGASWPNLVKLTPRLMAPLAMVSRDPLRQRWSAGFARSMAALGDDVVAERLRLIATEDVGPLLQALRVPVLVVHFEADQVIGAAAQAHLEAVCHNAEVLRLPGPHFALETKPRECAQAIGGRIRALVQETA